MDQNILDRLGIRYDEGVARCGGRAELYEQHLLRLPQGCRFAPRCPLAGEDCRRCPPELSRLSGEHLVRCPYARR